MGGVEGGEPHYLRGVLWVLGSRWVPAVLAGPRREKSGVVTALRGQC